MFSASFEKRGGENSSATKHFEPCWFSIFLTWANKQRHSFFFNVIFVLTFVGRASEILDGRSSAASGVQELSDFLLGKASTSINS